MGWKRQKDTNLKRAHRWGEEEPESLPETAILAKGKPLRYALLRGLEARQEEDRPAPARAVKPWGQGQLDADPMLQRDSRKL